MRAIMDFHHELVGIFAYQEEVSAALPVWVDFLKDRVRRSEKTTFDHSLRFGRGDPNSPGANYHHSASFRDLIEASREGGRNTHLHRNGVVALAYALWEEKYRQRIAIECGLGSKNDVKSDVFQDMNKYRQAILHVDGLLDREPVIIRFFGKGDAVAFTQSHMHDLFAYLVEELNRIGETYYGQSFGLCLDQPLN